MSGRGLLGDAPGQMAPFRLNQQINKIQEYYPTQPPPPPPRTPPIQPPRASGAAHPVLPVGPTGNPGMGLLGDAPPGLPRSYPPGATPTSGPGPGGPVHPLNQHHQLPVRSISNSNSLPLPPPPRLIQKQNKNILTQQIKKLKDLKGRVIILNFQKMASDESIVKMGNLFGEVKNYLNTSKGNQGKAWLEFYSHQDAIRAIELIGNGDVLHLNDPIDVGASTWKEIVRKDGKDLWKVEKERKRKYQDETESHSIGEPGKKRFFPEPDQNLAIEFDNQNSKIRRNSGNSEKSVKSEPGIIGGQSGSSSKVSPGQSGLSLTEMISSALELARKVESGEVGLSSTESAQVKLSLTEGIELVSILGKISRDQDLINAKKTLCSGLEL